jgi:hypothetical protein
LAWPVGWKRNTIGGVSRTPFRSGKGKVTVYDAITRLERELERLGADNPILSTNLRTGLRGDPLSAQPQPADRGAAVYFKLNGKDRVLACDVFTEVAGNIAAIANHIDALRRIERYGVGTMDQAFAGYDALPAPSAENRPMWRAILGFRPDTEVSVDDVRVNHRALAKASIGNDERLRVLNVARDQALVELGAPVR